MKTQLQIFYEEQDNIAARTASIMELVNHPTNPLTNQDLERSIDRWPERYGMYAGLIGKLKNEDDRS